MILRTLLSLPNTPSLRLLESLLLPFSISFFLQSSVFSQTTVLYSENFNASTTLGWSGSGGGVGSFSSTIVTSLSNNGFPTAPTSGYLALTASSANKATNDVWWAVQVLTNLSTPNGLGQTDLSKISFTAKVRAKGLPSNGAVAILKICATGDTPSQPTYGYKRITFEPVLLTGNDWVTIGGTFDDTGLQAAQGSRYNFTTTATSYEILVELSGYNQSTAPEYVAYNSPTGPSNGGRKNPGLAPNTGIRVEFDDVLLTVENPAAQTTAIGTVSPKSGGVGSSVTITGVAFGSSPTVSFNGTQATSVSVNGAGTSITTVVPAGATTGKITVVGANATTATSAYNFFVTSPTNLLADPNFDTSQGLEFWTYYDGARIITTNNVYPDATLGWNNIPGAQANSPYMFFPGWEGQPYPFFMQENIPFNPSNGDFFTATFQAKFEGNYSAGSTIIAFMDGLTEIATKDITGEIKANQKIDGELGAWRTYQATFKATPSILSAGRLTLKFQPLTRALTNMGSVFVDQITLAQTNAAAVGPQLAVKIGEISHPSNNVSRALISPLVGQTSVYQLRVDNTGGQDLTVTSVNVSGASFSVDNGASARTILPGSNSIYVIRTTPTVSGPLTGTLTINNNDKESADRIFTIPLTSVAVNLNDTFDGSDTAANLGWVASGSSASLVSTSSVTTSNGNLRLKINASSAATDWNWTYGVQKTFVSPGPLNLSNSQLSLRLCATGAFTGISGRPDLSTNKFEVLLESLNQYQEVSGSIRLGTWVDEKNPSGIPKGSTNYFWPDGTNDRVVLFLPDTTNSFTTFTFTNLSISSNIVQSGFNVNAPFFRLTLRANDANFGRDTNNTILVDSLGLSISQVGFILANGGFEMDTTNIPVPTPPLAWLQYPQEGVNKDIVSNGSSVFNRFDPTNLSTVFQAYTGARAMKIWAQNWKPEPDKVWIGPVQTGVVYQEFLPSASLAPGTKIYARGMAKIFSVDPLSGGSTFSYGFKYMDNQNYEIGRDVVTLTPANSSLYRDRWHTLTANGTIPSGTDKIQVICEFVQNNEADQGSVYLDDLSVGFGVIAPTTTVGGTPYSLIWSDEFDGTSLNSNNWVPEIGTGTSGWGNKEAQAYTTNSLNLRVENGSLVIQAVKSGTNWTSARIKSQGLRSFKYGKIEFRAKLPTGIGPWPAAWMLGTNFSSAGWPNCGEIDVMEWRGGFNGVANGDANTIGHALHSASRNSGNPVQPVNRSSVTNPSTEFHTFAVLWNSTNLVFSVDGVDKATLNPPAGDEDAFRKEFFLLLNLAMGGNYVGTNNATSIASALTNAVYEVDYVRVYQDPATLAAPTDTTPPVITLLGTNPASVNWGAAYSDAGATAFDAEDNASVTVTTSNGVNASVPGSYLITYTATDSKANTASTNRTVNVAMANGGTNRGSDGLTDVLRYAFGGTGTSSISSALLPSNTVSGGNLVLTYYARTNANVTLTPVTTTDLANSNSWTNTGVTESTISTVTTNGTTLEKRQASTPVSGNKKFLRLKATYTP